MARAPSPASIPGRSRLQFLSLPCFCRSPKPSEGEAEGAEQLPFLIVIPSGFSREQSAVDNPARTCGADPSCPRDSVPDDVRRERPRSCWHRLREDSLVPLNKSEGVVKTEISWAVREHRFFAREG